MTNNEPEARFRVSRTLKSIEHPAVLGPALRVYRTYRTRVRNKQAPTHKTNSTQYWKIEDKPQQNLV